MSLFPLKSERDVHSYAKTLISKLKINTTKYKRIIAWRPAHINTTIHWNSQHAYWIYSKKEQDRYTILTGTQNPEETKTLRIDCEFNILFNPNKSSLAGRIVQDRRGKIFICHSGSIGGGSTGIGKKAFRIYLGDDQFDTIHYDSQIKEAYIISQINDDKLLRKFRGYIELVCNFKKFKRTRSLNKAAFCLFIFLKFNN